MGALTIALHRLFLKQLAKMKKICHTHQHPSLFLQLLFLVYLSFLQMLKLGVKLVEKQKKYQETGNFVTELVSP